MPRQVLKKELLSLPEVKEILERKKDEIGLEMFDHFQETTYEYVTEFSKIPVAFAKELRKVLTEEFNLPEEFAVQIVNLFPQTVPEIKTILEKEQTVGKKMTDEDLTQLLARINELRDKYGE
ncbi:MAG: hypothetical protein ACTSU5_16120 [Promethearchaeota archaeon]